MEILKVILVILGILTVYAIVGTVEDDREDSTLGIHVPTLEQWCKDNPCACDDVGHKKLFVDLAKED